MEKLTKDESLAAIKEKIFNRSIRLSRKLTTAVNLKTPFQLEDRDIVASFYQELAQLLQRSLPVLWKNQLLIALYTITWWHFVWTWRSFTLKKVSILLALAILNYFATISAFQIKIKD